MEIPGYNLLGELGKGGMATVYLACQKSLNREVALKVMSPALAVDSTFTSRFIKEGQTIAQFSHPNIITIYDIGLAGHHHYIAMEYVGSKNLKDKLRQFTSLKEILPVIRQVALALGFAHQKGFVHRDVKPENILFREDGTAILTDFGIAKAVNSCTQLTNTGVSIGTPRYMSPEQARGGPITPAADLYALGIVLFELLSGRPPFSGPDTLTILYAHVNSPIPSLPERYLDLQGLINKLLAKQAKDRLASSKELLAAFDYYAQHHKLPENLLALAPLTTAIKITTNDTGTTLATQPPKKIRSTPPKASSLENSKINSHIAPKRVLVWGGLGLACLFVVSLIVFVVWPARSKNPITPIAQFPQYLPPSKDSVITNTAINQWLALAGQHFDAGQYTQPPEHNAEFFYRKILQKEPNHLQAYTGLAEIAKHYEKQALVFQNQGNIVEAAAQVELGLRVDPHHAPLLAFKEELRSILPSQSLANATSTIVQRPPTKRPFPLFKPAPVFTENQPVFAQSTLVQEDLETRERIRIAYLLASAEIHLKANRLSQPKGNNAVEAYNEVLQLDPQNERAKQGKRRIMYRASSALDLTEEKLETQTQTQTQIKIAYLLASAEMHLKANRLSQPKGNNALGAYNEVLQLDPQNERAKQGKRQITDRSLSVPIQKDSGTRQQTKIASLLASAEMHLEANQLSRPKGNNALETYNEVLRLDPQNKHAQQGKRRIADRYQVLAKQKIKVGRKEDARKYVTRGLNLVPDHRPLIALKNKLNAKSEAQGAQPHRSSQKTYTGPTKNPGKAGSGDNEYRQAEKYFYGTGVGKNYARAVEWYRKSAKAGNAKAQLSLGVCYANGKGVASNHQQALHWLRLAANKGEVQAQYLYGLGSLVGKPRNAKTAARWIEKAARRGYRRAYRVIGWMYEEGVGVKVSFRNSVRWNSKALFKSVRQSNGKGVFAWEQRFSTVSGK